MLCRLRASTPAADTYQEKYYSQLHKPFEKPTGEPLLLRVHLTLHLNPI